MSELIELAKETKLIYKYNKQIRLLAFDIEEALERLTKFSALITEQMEAEIADLKVKATHWEETCHAQWENHQRLFDIKDKKIAELQAHINRLREALDSGRQALNFYGNPKSYAVDLNTYVSDSYADGGRHARDTNLMIKQVLTETPAQSLKAHDDVLIERCAKECEYAATPYRDTDKFYICAEAVRALKG